MRCHVRGLDPYHRGRLPCIAMLTLFGMLWVALHFGVGHEDDD
jgi:hypothetical protein